MSSFNINMVVMEDSVPLLPNPIPNDRSMVVIRHVHDNSDYSVFPPTNHENLQIPQHHHHHTPQSPPSSSDSTSTSTSSSSFSFSPSDSDSWGLSPSSPFHSQVHKSVDFFGWISLGLEILRSKLFPIVESFRNRGPIWSIWVPSAAVVMSWWMIMRNRRRRRFRRNETRLKDIIKEKDGRIAQLLHQIAQMNEILIARHKALAAKVGE